VTPPGTCPGYYLTQDEGEHHAEPRCPWQNGNMPEGVFADSFEEFCARCERNQLRADAVNAPQPDPPPFPAVCEVFGNGTAPGKPCALDPHRLVCEVACSDYRVIA
jgi:hypothetical protein